MSYRPCRTVFFYDNLGLFSWIKSLFNKREVYYNSQTLVIRLIFKLLGGGLGGHIKSIWYGDLAKSTGIRKSAYKRALKKVNETSAEVWGELNLDEVMGIDQGLICDKFMFDFLFNKYEFYGLANQYMQEHQDCSFEIVVAPLFFDEGLFENINVNVIQSMRFHKLEFILSIMGMVLFFPLFWMKHKNNNPSMENSIVCEVDGKKSYDMFYDLFGGFNNLYFVTQKCYIQNFEGKDIQQLDLNIHGLDSEGFQQLKVLTWHIFTSAVKQFRKLSSYGIMMFDLYKTIAHGLVLTENMRNSTYLTYEHMDTSKAVRNELLRKGGNRSVFVPHGVYAIDHFYVPEYRYNYDVLCSPGQLLERVYHMQKAKTKVFLATGPYHPNKRSACCADYHKRMKKVIEFKGASTAITILCNGSLDATFSGEVRLMKLACKLSEVLGIKVILRLKPMPLPAKYSKFYIDHIVGHKSILLTGSEYDLFDFLDVTDIFITSASSSAVDLCAAGADFFSVDFWDDKDLYLWQTVVEGIFLEEETAFNSILDWVSNSRLETRLEHKVRMNKLSNLISYKFESFESYKRNLLKELDSYLPKIND